jgi:next-to-BRCA1 protein 1
MATSTAAQAPVGPDTPISIRITVNGMPKKFKLPLADLVPQVLPGKLRTFLSIAENQAAVFERYSDSSASYVNLDPSNLHAYRTLYRAAKAKLKLRLRATVGPLPVQSTPLAGLSETLNSLANLSFGSEATLATVAGPSGPTLASASSSATKLEIPVVEPISAPQTASDTTAVAAAIVHSVPVVSPSTEATVPAAESSKAPVSPPRPSSFSADLAKELKQLEAFKAKFGMQQSCSRLNFKSHPAYIPQEVPKPAFRMSNPAHLPLGATYSFSVFCNECNKNMLNEHYHCDVCEGGDYDLCTECLALGKHCLDDNHWLIKRCMRDGKVMNATTETVTCKAKNDSAPKDIPGAYTEEKKFEEPEAFEVATRTCNCCVKVFNEDAFVTCRDCEDYDLCVPCLEDGKHGHHPGHRFDPASTMTTLSNGARALCNPGRNVHHSAICDNCNNRIVGVRHKCLNCPDWDYCSSCVRKAPFIHTGHRFAPVYEAIPADSFQSSPSHVSVYCDGPLCKTKNACITGIRYKCAVCPDIDFCASCEALPRLEHNRTHPLLKFRTPVRGCSITTLVGEDQARQAEQSTTQICTVAEVKPTESPVKSVKEKIEIKDLLAEPIQEKVPVPEVVKEQPKLEINTVDLQAHFIRDTISDGTSFSPERQFVQVWTLKNPGPHDWPAGCSVRYVGGDNMLNVDDSRPSSDADYSKATESNIIRRPVKVGEEISFRVLMKAPKREGVAISYWRLKAADGVPFGHRLWCHINVASQPTSPASDKDATREIGRLGSHDAFLRLFLNEQSKRAEQAPEASDSARESLAKLQDARLSAMRDALRQKMKTRIMEKYKADNAAAGPSTTVKRVIPIKVEETKPVELAVEPPAAAELSSSKMIFPTLQKESPEASTHEDAVTTNTAPATENVPAVAAASEEAELFEDAESVSLVDGSDDEDEGFLTEEEYDILDASDEDA